MVVPLALLSNQGTVKLLADDGYENIKGISCAGGAVGIAWMNGSGRLNRLKAEKQDRLMRVCSVKKYVENLRGPAGPIDIWNEQAWCLLVTQVTVRTDGGAEFLFRGENRITVK